MPRAFLLILDSLGAGGAEDADKFGDKGSNTIGHLAEACARGAGDLDGLRSGPLTIPNLTRLGIGQAVQGFIGADASGVRSDAGTGGDFWLWRGDFDRQRHAVGALGNIRCASHI